LGTVVLLKFHLIHFSVYIVSTLLYALTIVRASMKSGVCDIFVMALFIFADLLVVQHVTVVVWIVTIASYCASLSSALSALVGAARTLQAVARDGIMPLRWFAPGSGPGDEPRPALIVTWVLVQACLFIPSLDIIANYASMFYLMSFCVVNLAGFMLSVTGTANFRPSWKYFGWPTSLAGTLISLGIMFYLDYVAAGASVVAMLVVFLYVHWRAPVVNWGHISQALIYHQVRKYLLRLDPRKEHLKFWRPAILLAVASPRGSQYLIDFCNNLKKGGLFVLSNVHVGRDRSALQV